MQLISSGGAWCWVKIVAAKPGKRGRVQTGQFRKAWVSASVVPMWDAKPCEYWICSASGRDGSWWGQEGVWLQYRGTWIHISSCTLGNRILQSNNTKLFVALDEKAYRAVQVPRETPRICISVMNYFRNKQCLSAAPGHRGNRGFSLAPSYTQTLCSFLHSPNCSLTFYLVKGVISSCLLEAACLSQYTILNKHFNMFKLGYYWWIYRFKTYGHF